MDDMASLIAVAITTYLAVGVLVRRTAPTRHGSEAAPY
jgi:hypothetical protein